MYSLLLPWLTSSGISKFPAGNCSSLHRPLLIVETQDNLFPELILSNLNRPCNIVRRQSSRYYPIAPGTSHWPYVSIGASICKVLASFLSYRQRPFSETYPQMVRLDLHGLYRKVERLTQSTLVAATFCALQLNATIYNSLMINNYEAELR